MTHRSALDQLEIAIKLVGGLTAFAEWADVDHGNLSRMRSGKRQLTKKVLDAIGLERIVSYRKKRS